MRLVALTILLALVGPAAAQAEGGESDDESFMQQAFSPDNQAFTWFVFWMVLIGATAAFFYWLGKKRARDLADASPAHEPEASPSSPPPSSRRRGRLHPHGRTAPHP